VIERFDFLIASFACDINASTSECTAEYAFTTAVLLISVESVPNMGRIDALPPPGIGAVQEKYCGSI